MNSPIEIRRNIGMSRLVIEGNSVYEIDEDCEKNRKETMEAEKKCRTSEKRPGRRPGKGRR